MIDPGVGVRVLFVDDSGGADHVADRLRGTDRSPPVRVAVERDPAAALDRLSGVDCVVTAYDLPGTDGIALADSVAARRPSTPVVLFPEHGDEAVAAAALAADVADYVPRDPAATLPGVDADPYCRLVDCVLAAVRQDRSRSDEEIAAARFRSLAESIPEAVVVLDEGSRIRYANPAVEGVFGYPPDAVRGDHVSVLCPGVGDGDGFPADPSSGRTADLELVGRHRDGHEVAVEVSTGEFADDGDRFFPCVVRSARE